MMRMITIGTALVLYGVGLMHFGSPLDLLINLFNWV